MIRPALASLLLALLGTLAPAAHAALVARLRPTLATAVMETAMNWRLLVNR